MEWIHMTDDQINSIEDKKLRKNCMYKLRMFYIHIINPLYDSLSSSKQLEFKNSDCRTIYEKAHKLKSLCGEETEKILYARFKS